RTAPSSSSTGACTSRGRSASWTRPMSIPASNRAAPCWLMSPAIRPSPATLPASSRHFVADEPPPQLVERLEQIFRDPAGNLKERARGLITAEEAWAPEQTKLKRPCEWAVAMIRATGTRGDPEPFALGQGRLGEPLWTPPSPKGFDDNEA